MILSDTPDPARPARVTEADLRSSEIRYRRLFESAHDGILILDASSRRITDANPFIIDLLGYERAELLGLELWQIGLLADADAARGAFEELQRTGIIRYEHLPLVSKSGQLREVEFISNLYQEGDRQVIQCNIRDITDRVLARRQAQQSEERFRFLAESIPHMVVTLGPGGEIDYVNPQWVAFSGLSVQQIRHQFADLGASELIHPRDRIESHRLWDESLRTAEAFACEHRLQRADGLFRWHLSRVHTKRDRTGKGLTWICSTTDIHDQKRSEEKLEQLILLERAARETVERANQAQDDFLAHVSHELRTPLTAILGWSTLLEQSRLSEANQRRAFEVLPRSARTLAQLVEDILDVSRIQTGNLSLDRQPLAPASVVISAMDSVRAAHEAKALRIQTSVPTDIGLVAGDPARLEQVLLNLLSNAIKFTPRGGSIQVALDRVGNDAQITVTDTGCGIDAALLPHIFDRFRQAQGASTQRNRGLGLGLSIARSIVALHGGTLGVVSDGAQQGASFSVRLPLLPAADQSTAQQQSERKGAGRGYAILPSLEGLSVLVVDDEPNTREMIKAVLQQAGLAVRTCESATAGLSMLEHWKPSVLISDIAMPERDGCWLIDQVRSGEQDCEHRLPAIALTALVQVRDRTRLLARGFDMFVPKPIEPDELLAVIAQLAVPEPGALASQTD